MESEFARKRKVDDNSRKILTYLSSLNKTYDRTECLGLLYLHMLNNYGENNCELSELIASVEDEKLRERLKYIISEPLWQAMRIKLNSVNSKNIVEYWNELSVNCLPGSAESIYYYKIFEKAANCNENDSVLTNLMLTSAFADKTLSKNVSMVCNAGNRMDDEYTQALLNKAFNSYCIKLMPITESELLTSNREFDKIILNWQFTRRMKISSGKNFYSDISDNILGIMGKLKKSSSQSRLGVIVSSDYLFNENNKDFVSYLIEEKLLEKIIVLTHHRMSRINCYMLIIAGKSLKTNDMEFIDYSGIDPIKYSMRTSYSQISNDIENNYAPLQESADYATIKRYNYDINPYSYISINTEGVRLKDYILKSVRGRVLTAEDIEEYKSDITTKFKYLKQSDICDGIISEELTSLKYIPENMRAYVLEENCIVLSKNIKRGFAAVIENIGENEIIAEQNLLVIQVDTNKIDPWFLTAYLNIEEYSKLIKTTKKLSLSKIENIVVPIPDNKATQNALGKTYKNKLSELKIAYTKLEAAAKNIYEDNEWFNL